MTHPIIKDALTQGSAYINCCLVTEQTDFHSHNFVEIAYVAEGSGIHAVGSSSYNVESGHITLINYDIPHQFIATQKPLLIYNCIFTPGYFDNHAWSFNRAAHYHIPSAAADGDREKFEANGRKRNG